MAVTPVPQGYSTVTPYIVVKGAARAIDWYRDALGAEEVFRMPGADGRILHGEIRIGDSIVMISDEFPEMGTSLRSPESLGGASAALWVYTEDCDAMYSKAIGAGAKADNPPMDMFWGDRYGRFTDPFGLSWSVATHKEDVPPEEMERRQREFQARVQSEKPAS